jgi:hypothetical protein
MEARFGGELAVFDACEDADAMLLECGGEAIEGFGWRMVAGKDLEAVGLSRFHKRAFCAMDFAEKGMIEW